MDIFQDVQRNFIEISHWRFEESKPEKEVNEGLLNGNLRLSVEKMNSSYRAAYWSFWFKKRTRRLSKSDCYNPQFRDYLGLCIWDYKRQGYLGLAHTDDRFIDPLLGPPRTSESHFFKASLIANRWNELFELEVSRLPGGQLTGVSEDLKVTYKYGKAFV